MERTLPDQSRLRQNRRSAVLTATEPPSIFTVKSLLHPVLAAGSLMGCVLFWGETLHGPYFLLAVLTFLATAEFLDVAQLRRDSGPFSELRSLVTILLRWTLFIAFIGALLYLSKLADLFQIRVLATWAVITAPVLWLGEIGMQLLVAHRAPAAQPRTAVIVGVTELGLRLEAQLQRDPSLHMQVAGFFEDRGPDRLPIAGAKRVLGKSSELPEFIKQHDVKVVYVTLPMTRHPRILDLLSALRDSTVSVYFVPDLFVFDLVQARFDVIGGIPVVAVCESPFYGASGIAKRFIDLIIATIVLVLCAPLLLLIAIGVRLNSSGPIMFKQKRYGLDGREILIYKFRSMSVTEDGATNYQQVTRHDARVTPFGAFMRRLSLDELPQLFNVLEGSLSIVGPRPHAIAVNEQYRKLIPGYMLRHKIKPGITGWAQINGYRGGDDLESMRKRVEFDLDYLRHWSVTLDLSIILRTAAIVWHDRRAY
jgi:putative colanic acid biosynthesis UDP-glucose lipid carrier transferase